MMVATWWKKAHKKFLHILCPLSPFWWELHHQKKTQIFIFSTNENTWVVFLQWPLCEAAASPWKAAQGDFLVSMCSSTSSCWYKPAPAHLDNDLLGEDASGETNVAPGLRRGLHLLWGSLQPAPGLLMFISHDLLSQLDKGLDSLASIFGKSFLLFSAIRLYKMQREICLSFIQIPGPYGENISEFKDASSEIRTY